MKGVGVGRGVPLENLSIVSSKGAFWSILGLIKPTFDRPGVSIFLPAVVWGGGDRPIAPPVDPPLQPTPCRMADVLLRDAASRFSSAAGADVG